MILNALGNEIKIGDILGYVNKQNGIATAFVGEVTGFTAKQVTLKVLRRGRTSYENPIYETDIGKPTTSAMGNALMPVNLEDLNWKPRE